MANLTDTKIYGVLELTGNLKTKGNIRNCITVIDTYQMLSSDDTVVCNKEDAFVVTLPTAVVGQVFTVKNIGAGTVTLEGLVDDTIDGAANKEILQWACVTVQCYEANKWVVL